jgi:hypothetical protein
MRPWLIPGHVSCRLILGDSLYAASRMPLQPDTKGNHVAIVTGPEPINRKAVEVQEECS